MSEDVLRTLERLGTSAVSDVLDAAGLKQRRLKRLYPVTVPRVVAGEAVTVQVVPMVPTDPRADRHLGAAAVDQATDRSVIVVNVANEPTISGAWGGLLSLASQIKGVRGTVVQGLCRDTDEIRNLEYPVFAMGSTPLTARGRVREVAYSVDIQVGGVTVKPGDHVVADSDGVLVLGQTSLAAVVERGPDILEKEELFAARIRRGEPLSAVLGLGYESLTNQQGDADDG